MMMFLIISILMVIAIIFIFYPFVVQMPESQVDEHLAQNVQAHEQRLTQIQLQLDGGLFDEEEAQIQRTQSARQLLKDEGQSKRVNTEIKSYMNFPVIMSVALVSISILFYMQKGYQLDLNVTKIQSEIDSYPDTNATKELKAQKTKELLETKKKALEKNSKAHAVQWHQLGIEQLGEDLVLDAKASFEKSFEIMVGNGEYDPNEAAYLKARLANTELILNKYKSTAQVVKYLDQSEDFAQSNLATQLREFITVSEKVFADSKTSTNEEDWIVGVTLIEFGELELALEHILNAANKTQALGNNPGFASRAFAVAAEITVSENDGEFNDQALAFLSSAFSNNPNDFMALQLASKYTFDNKEYELAYQTLNILVKEPYFASYLTDEIMDMYAKTLLELGRESELKGLISVEVDLDPKLKATADKGQFLFVLARPVGQRMPLGVKKIPMSEVTFPLTVYLSDLNAMTPEMTISSQENIEVVARVSLSGIANAAAGEPESEALIVPKNTKSVSVKIDTIH